MKKQEKLNLAEEGQEMAMVRLTVSLPAVTAFAKNRLAAFDALTNGMRHTMAGCINSLLSSEMSVFLGAVGQEGNKRNGTRGRDYYLKGVGMLRIEMPRDRRGEFDSVIMPDSERVDPRTRQDLALLHLAGLSTRTLAMISNRLLGIEVSKDTVSNSLDLVADEARRWLTRSLEGKRYWALYIDGTNFKVQRRGSTEREPSLVVLGVDAGNHRSVLAVEPGQKDNVESWRAVFAELKARGLDAEAVEIGIMDGLPGLERAFKEAFPKAVTARCWVHAERNVLAKTPARYAEAMKTGLTSIMYADGEAAARGAFATLKGMFGSDAERAIGCLEKDLESLLAHYRFDKRFWQALKTTNPIERINKEFKRRTKSMETIGEATLEAVVAFVCLRLEVGWQHHTIDARALDNLSLSPTRTLRPNTVQQAIQKLTEPIN